MNYKLKTKCKWQKRFAELFLDPMVSGVYGGDARSANLKAVFPRIYAMEEEYGSLFKAMIKIRKARKADVHGAARDFLPQCPGAIKTDLGSAKR